VTRNRQELWIAVPRELARRNRSSSAVPVASSTNAAIK